VAPVVLLDYDAALDDHLDFDLAGVENVISVGAHMGPRDNLGTQVALIAGSRYFLGTCGGLAWLAPFLGVPTVAVYDDDRLIAPHLLVARHAGALVKAAEFAPLDLRALARVGAL
jgi:ADP-heptose:LPS heptosyltransferase